MSVEVANFTSSNTLSCASAANALVSCTRGVKAITDIKNGTEIAFVPRDRLVVASDVCEELGVEMPDDSSEQAFLTLYLVHVTRGGATSSLTPLATVVREYLSTLPEEYGAMPMFLNVSHLTMTELQSRFGLLPNVVDLIHVQHAKARDEYNKICGLLSPQINWEKEFVPMWCAVNTRCVSVRGQNVSGSGNNNNNNNTMALCADGLLEMYNHSPLVTCTGSYVSDRNGYSLRVGYDVDAGQQVFIAYGSHGNDKLLVEYGFVFDETWNPSSELTFRFDSIQKLLGVEPKPRKFEWDPEPDPVIRDIDAMWSHFGVPLHTTFAYSVESETSTEPFPEGLWLAGRIISFVLGWHEARAERARQEKEEALAGGPRHPYLDPFYGVNSRERNRGQRNAGSACCNAPGGCRSGTCLTAMKEEQAQLGKHIAQYLLSGENRARYAKTKAPGEHIPLSGVANFLRKRLITPLRQQLEETELLHTEYTSSKAGEKNLSGGETYLQLCAMRIRSEQKVLLDRIESALQQCVGTA
eukprot:PhM_4_TR15561/c0_g3_i1/m.100283